MADVLVLGPHPDDIEICAGGLVLSMIARGYSVAGVDMTAGESGTRGSPEERRAEALEGGRRLGLSARECLGLPDGGLQNDSASRDLLINAIRKHRPRLLVAPYPMDHHPDHARTGALAKDARFLAGCAQIGPQEHAAWRPGRVLFYPSREVLEPSLVVDVTDVFEQKLEAVRAHRSQLHQPASNEPRTTISAEGFLSEIEAQARTYGAQIGVRFGEAFVVDGPLAVEDPLPVVRDKGQSVYL
ncbi:MAG: bacillithiol biosynthesis deacetylase BshB1 [Planctomycetota bacterium]|nr:MAG: bacillithiol biosynthesis deacetylase BshB1 [Planctomycetota bacterium]